MDFPFWESGSGNRSRVFKLITYLLKHSFLTVVYVGKKPHYQVKHLIPPKMDFIMLEDDVPSDRLKNIELVNKLMEVNQYTACIIEYIHLSYFLRSIPEGTISILDTHDIVSESNYSFNKAGLKSHAFEISKEKEYKIYNLYDYVLFISQEDFNSSLPFMEIEKMLLVPHSPQMKFTKVNLQAQTIGFVASSYTPNILGIEWFLTSVWPLVADDTIRLHIIGSVCAEIDPKLIDDRIILRHYQPNLEEVYSSLDILINPVSIGAGLKIKNIEALAFGKPLITTLHSGKSLGKHYQHCVKIVNTPNEFVSAIKQLCEDYDTRRDLSEKAYAFAAKHYNEHQCYGELKKITV